MASYFSNHLRRRESIAPTFRGPMLTRRHIWLGCCRQLFPSILFLAYRQRSWCSLGRLSPRARCNDGSSSACYIYAASACHPTNRWRIHHKQVRSGSRSQRLLLSRPGRGSCDALARTSRSQRARRRLNWQVNRRNGLDLELWCPASIPCLASAPRSLGILGFSRRAAGGSAVLGFLAADDARHKALLPVIRYRVPLNLNLWYVQRLSDD
jgi:hypothetical protein